MTAAQPAARGHSSGEGLPGSSAAIAREAGELALLIAERGAMHTDLLATIGASLSVILERLPATSAALFRLRGRRTGSRRALQRVAMLGATSEQAQQLRAAADQAIADGRLLVRPLARDSMNAPGERVLALPLGAPSALGALALAWPMEDDDADMARRLPLLSRLVPVLLTALRPLLMTPPRAGTGTASPAASLPARALGTPAVPFDADLLAWMSHEVRTPLNSMSGFVEIVLDGLAGPLTERQREFLTYARASTHHLIRLIEDILLLGSEADQRILRQRARTSARPVAERALASVQDRAVERHIALNLESAPALPVLAVDDVRLAQALANLLGFLIDRAPVNSAVLISITMASEHEVEFVLSGEGPALVPAEVEHLFEPAQPCFSSTTHGTTGLELPVARVIVVQHGGALTAANTPTGGAQFQLVIPLSTD